MKILSAWQITPRPVGPIATRRASYRAGARLGTTAGGVARWLVFAALIVLALPSQAQLFNIFGLTNAVWKYDSTNDWYGPTGLGWTATNFNDSAWPSGRALLSSDGNAEIVPLRGTLIRDMRNPVPGVPGSTANQAVYFRIHFTWPTNVSPTAVLRLTCRVDDGVAIYLNGNRVDGGRLRMGDPVGHGSFATALVPCVSASGNNDGTCDEEIIVDSAFLVEGDNVLAVSAHSNNSTSSDVTWGCRLDGIIPFPPMIVNTNEPADRVVLQNRSTTLTVSATASPPIMYQWYFEAGTNGGGFIPIQDATNASYTITNMAAANEGLYYATVSNPVGSTNSRTATVRYREDNVPPIVTRVLGSADSQTVVVEFNERLEAASASDEFNYDFTPVLTVSDATNSIAGGHIVLLTLGAPLQPDTLYNASIHGVRDEAGNEMVTTNIEFRSWMPSGCNGLLFEIFRGLSTTDNSLAQLTNNINYPNNPAIRTNLTTFDSDPYWGGLSNTDPLREGYGARFRGVFVPPYSGAWRFFVRSDDASLLFVNTNGPAESGKSAVAREAGCCNAFLAPGAAQTSDPFALIGGQAYYIEYIFKEGTGGDYGQVAARLEGDPTLPASLTPIPPAWLGYPAVPANIVGPVQLLANLPANVTVAEHTPVVTLSVTASNAQGANICYQWQISESGGPFTDILNAIGPTYSIPFPTVAADNGDQYRVLVQVPGSSAMSSVATLTITNDVTPPRVTRVLATNDSTILVWFSEPLAGGADDAFVYALNLGGQVGTAVTNADSTRVVLTTSSPLTLGTVYTLTVNGPGGGGGSGIRDPAGNPLTPDPTLVMFRAQNFFGNVDTLRTLPTNNVLPVGALTERGILARIVQVTTAIGNDNTVTEQILSGVYPSATNPALASAFSSVFIETNAINYDRTAGTNTGAFGHIAPDLQFPGFPLLESTPGASYENMAMEAVAWVQLSFGIVRMGVNSDDGFRVTPALSVADSNNNSIVLGEFNGGRGAADTVFDFYVPQDGLYPFRLIWEQGQGGANVEWWVHNMNANIYEPINGASNGPPAFLPACTAKTLTAWRSDTNLVVQWPQSGGGDFFQLQYTDSLATPPSATVWTSTPQIPQLSADQKRATIPMQGPMRIYRLYRPGPACP